MQKLLTFIIPMYNALAYIDETLSSIVKAPANVLDKIEIIVVNDGSTDCCEDIVAKYTTEYPEIIKLINKQNAGHGSGINIGVRKASGVYFRVLDADDWIQTDSLADYLAFVERCSADVILNPYVRFDVKESSYKNVVNTNHIEQIIDDKSRLLTIDELLSHWEVYKRITTIHSMTYATEFYLENEKIIPEHVSYDDAFYTTAVMSQARTVAVTDTSLYVYRVGTENQSVSIESRKKKLKDHKIVITTMLLEYQNTVSEIARNYQRIRIASIIADYLVTVLILVEDKKAGRELAKSLYNSLSVLDKKLRSLVIKRYRILLAINRLHININFYNRLIGMR